MILTIYLRRRNVYMKRRYTITCSFYITMTFSQVFSVTVRHEVAVTSMGKIRRLFTQMLTCKQNKQNRYTTILIACSAGNLTQQPYIRI